LAELVQHPSAGLAFERSNHIAQDDCGWVARRLGISKSATLEVIIRRFEEESK
jgi:hypothetical protein